MTWPGGRRFLLPLAALVAGGMPAAFAQIPTPFPVGDGLLATYYKGENFEQPVVRRHETRLDYEWALQPPVPGVPAEHFSVRWQGWLVPPVGGRYLLHLRIDDGLRLWLNGRQIVNEWRDQYFSDYTVAVDLQAGQAYELRIDYYQNLLESRMRLAWERPGQPTPAPARVFTWRSLLGMREAPPAREEVVTAAYLFTRPPRRVAAKKQPVRPVEASVLPPSRPAAATAPPKPRPVAAVAKMKVAAPRPRPVPQLGSPRPAPARQVPTPTSVPNPARPAPAALPAADSAARQGAAAVARLADKQPVVLAALYFEQSQARLRPAARPVLDGLAAALRQRPALRLEVQGHTDNQGSAELNRQLSQQRADVVCLYLSAHGVAAERLRPKGYGGTQPVADNADLAQRPRNRRVVFVPQ